MIKRVYILMAEESFLVTMDKTSIKGVTHGKFLCSPGKKS